MSTAYQVFVCVPAKRDGRSHGALFESFANREQAESVARSRQAELNAQGIDVICEVRIR